MTVPASSQAGANGGQPAGIYVYCVARTAGRGRGGGVDGGADSGGLGPVVGLAGRTVHTVPGPGICAVAHDCPAEPYQSDDPAVVEGWVLAHQNVIRAATKAFGTVLPMAFDMIVRGDSAEPASPDGSPQPGRGPMEALTAWLQAKADRFIRMLDRLAGTAEYGVQVLWDRGQIAASLLGDDAELRAIREQGAGLSKGLAHLHQQRLAKAVRNALQRQADLFAQDFYTRIRRCVRDVRIDKLKLPSATAAESAGDGRQMLLNLSCLLDECDSGAAAGGRRQLGRVLDAIQQTAGITVRFTGPWPPYSFVGG